VTLDGVVAESSRGVLHRSSSATYTLRVHCQDFEKLADVLVAATVPKTAKLMRMRWKFSRDRENEEACLRAALEAATKRAHIVAEVLGVQVNSVHRSTYEIAGLGDETQVIHAEEAMHYRAARAGPASEVLGMPVEHRKNVRVSVHVEFRIGRPDSRDSSP